MAVTRVLIAVKTYPAISAKYDELVCTAGFKEDGTWIRIYPIPFRKKSFDQQYKKYQWIEIDLEKNESDFRPESYRPHSIDSEIKIVGEISTKNYGWDERKKIVLNTVYNDISKLINEAKDVKKRTSLAVFKPTKITAFVVEKVSSEWDEEKLKKLENKRKQLGLFVQPEEDFFKVVRKLPYKFSYEFEDINGRKCTLMIEDWEIGQLYWNCCHRSGGDEKKACDDVINKYGAKFIEGHDLFFYLGTTQKHHLRSRNPFIIIGVFYPPIVKESPQLGLF